MVEEVDEEEEEVVEEDEVEEEVVEVDEVEEDEEKGFISMLVVTRPWAGRCCPACQAGRDSLTTKVPMMILVLEPGGNGWRTKPPAGISISL